MSPIHPIVDRTRRRLALNLFAERLCLALVAAAGCWIAIILATRVLALGLPVWSIGWVVGGLGLVVAVIWTVVTRPTALHAAVTLDRAAGLKERISTAIAVERLGDPFARAAVRDAERTAGHVHVPAHIRYRPPTLWPWSGALIIAAVVLALFMPDLDLFSSEAEAAAVPREQVEAERRAINTEIEQRIQKLKELSRDTPGLDESLEGIEPLPVPDTPGATPEDIRREAVKRIDDVQDKLKRQLEALDPEALTDLKRRLGQLDQPGAETGNDELSKALAAGDMAAAKKALEKMRKEFQEAAKNADDSAAQQKLKEMERRLENLANQLSKVSNTKELQKELENKAGLSEEQAKKLLEQLANMDPKQLEKELQRRLGEKGLSQEQIKQLAEKMAQNQQAQKMCQQLAQSLSKAAQGCKACNNPGSGQGGATQAMAGLAEAGSQLSQLEMSEQLMAELEAQLAELDDLKQGVCQGGMCPGGNRGQRSSNVGAQGGNYGLGLGERIGRRATPYETDPTKAKLRYKGGEIIGQMLIDGPQVRGAASAEVLDAVEADLRDAQDAIERHKIPRQYERVLREYFERYAGLARDIEKGVGEAEAGSEDGDESGGEGDGADA